MPLLTQIVQQQVPDVRVALRESKELLLESIASGEMNPLQKLKTQTSVSDEHSDINPLGSYNKIDLKGQSQGDD